MTVASIIFLWLKSVPMTPALNWLAWIGLELSPLVPLVMLVGCCSSGLRGAFGRALELPPIVAIGRVSYGVYLFHPIVLSLIVKAQPWIPVNVSEQGPGRFVIGTAATLMVASISWLAFEKPLNQLKRYFPYVSSKAQARIPSSVGPSEVRGPEYEASAIAAAIPIAAAGQNADSDEHVS